jgi:naphthoate synthase
LKETLKWCETMKGHSALTIRMTKRSLNFESDNLYSSWQHGMELLAHVWGSDEAKEGMNAFLAGRQPDFQKFRMRDKKELESYLAGYERDENAPPHMRGNGSGGAETKAPKARRKNGKQLRARAS